MTEMPELVTSPSMPSDQILIADWAALGRAFDLWLQWRLNDRLADEAVAEKAPFDPRPFVMVIGA